MDARATNDFDDAIRQMDRRPTLHPHARHKTQAGPARHEMVGRFPDGKYGGLLVTGMRKYEPVRIVLFDINPVMDRIRASKPRYWWRWDPDYVRIVRALNRYRRNKYSRDLMNALVTAWRC